MQDRDRRVRGVQVKVRVLNLTHLPKADLFGKCDPYCVLQCLHSDGNTTKFQTEVVKNTYEAEYNEEFVFDISFGSGGQESLLTITVMDRSAFRCPCKCSPSSDTS